MQVATRAGGDRLGLGLSESLDRRLFDTVSSTIRDVSVVTFAVSDEKSPKPEEAPPAPKQVVRLSAGEPIASSVGPHSATVCWPQTLQGSNQLTGVSSSHEFELQCQSLEGLPESAQVSSAAASACIREVAWSRSWRGPGSQAEVRGWFANWCPHQAICLPGP